MANAAFLVQICFAGEMLTKRAELSYCLAEAGIRAITAGPKENGNLESSDLHMHSRKGKAIKMTPDSWRQRRSEETMPV